MEGCGKMHPIAVKYIAPLFIAKEKAGKHTFPLLRRLLGLT